MRRTLFITLVIFVLMVFGFIYYGSQRAIHALLNGNVVEAFKHNAMLFIAIPWILLCLFAETQRVRNPRLYVRLNAPLLIWLFLAMVLLWWLLRNIFNW